MQGFLKIDLEAGVIEKTCILGQCYQEIDIASRGLLSSCEGTEDAHIRCSTLRRNPQNNGSDFCECWRLLGRSRGLAGHICSISHWRAHAL